MRGHSELFTSLVAGACLLVSVPAQACWRTEHVAAAKVRELDSMLMVSALRCRTGANDYMAAYNAFVERRRPALTQVNNLLRSHFADSVGKANALNAYDNYVTKMANRYGAGVAGLNCRDMSSILVATMNEGETLEMLAAVADRAEIVAIIDEPMCAPTIIAAAQPEPVVPAVTRPAPRTAGIPPKAAPRRR